MATIPRQKTFIIDCPSCKRNVAANEKGRVEQSGNDPDSHDPYGYRVLLGTCPDCGSVLVGTTVQIGFEEFNASIDQWEEVSRVYPDPPKVVFGPYVPRIVKKSLDEAARSLRCGANIAACAMLGRALEALCRDKSGKKKKITLLKGIEKLKEKGVIDDRLYEWSQELRVFRNLAAHPEDENISRQDAEDLQIFVYAIVDYIYNLTERYEEFKAREDLRRSLKP